MAILVDDLQVAVKRFTDLGVKFKKRPEEGSMRHIAFILDPGQCCASATQLPSVHHTRCSPLCFSV